jgi:hypothetical protein
MFAPRYAMCSGFLVLAALAATAHGMPAQSDAPAIEWGENAYGLQMSISLSQKQDASSLAPAITLRLRNVGDMSRKVILGEDCSRPAAGARANLVALDIRNASGKVTRLRDPVFCLAGKFLFEVFLPPGATFSTPLKLGAYEPGSGPHGAAAIVWGRDWGTLQALLTVDPGSAQRICASNQLEITPSTSEPSDRETRSWGDTVNALRMSISIDAALNHPTRLPSLKLVLQNVGSDDLFVILGGGCGMQGGPRPNGVKLNLRNSAGNYVTLNDLGPGPPYQAGCAGAIAIVPAALPPGATYSIPLRFDYYRTLKFSQALKDFEPGWEGGQSYSVTAELTLHPTQENLPPGALNVRFGRAWAGTVKSNDVEIHFPVN